MSKATEKNTVAECETDARTGDRLVEVYLPKNGRHDNEQYVSVNGTNMLIKMGITVKVPERFAAVIGNSEDMRAQADAYIENNISA